MKTQDKDSAYSPANIGKHNEPVDDISSWKKTNFSIESNGVKPYDIQQMTDNQQQ